jgi:hypothetical protein
MTLKKQLKQTLGKKATRRVYAAAPWVGGALAVAAGVVVQRRGVRRVVEDIRDLSSTVEDRARESHLRTSDSER